MQLIDKKLHQFLSSLAQDFIEEHRSSVYTDVAVCDS